VTNLPSLNDDFLDMVQALRDAGAEFMIVGAHAMAAHGVPRATGDLDILVRPTPDNAARVLSALRQFGAPIAAHGIRQLDFERPGNVYQIGLPPRRIDLLTQISGVSFEDAWHTRLMSKLGTHEVAFLGRDTLLKNKRAAGRDKDLVDVRLLEKQG